MTEKTSTPPIKCPRCGSEEITPMQPELTTWHTCRACGWEFVNEKDSPEEDSDNG